MGFSFLKVLRVFEDAGMEFFPGTAHGIRPFGREAKLCRKSSSM